MACSSTCLRMSFRALFTMRGMVHESSLRIRHTGRTQRTHWQSWGPRDFLDMNSSLSSLRSLCAQQVFPWFQGTKDLWGGPPKNPQQSCRTASRFWVLCIPRTTPNKCWHEPWMQHFRDEIHIADVVSTLSVRENRLIFPVNRTKDSVGLCLLERSDRGERKMWK